MNATQPDLPDVVEARPVLTSRIGYALAVVVFVTFVVIALVMRRANDGVPFTYKDQWGTAFIGLVLAGLCLMPTRPRLRADREAIHTRAFLGGWRTIPWAAVVRLDFPRNVRFARIVLPAEETMAIYAVQRWDGQHAVVTMRGLRALLEASRSAARTRDA
jgi:Bacterial PH domain